jgi:hypothetical protein
MAERVHKMMFEHSAYVERMPESSLIRETMLAINDTKMYKPLLTEEQVRSMWNPIEYSRSSGRQALKSTWLAIARSKRGHWTNVAMALFKKTTCSWETDSSGSDDELDGDEEDERTQMRLMLRHRITRTSAPNGTQELSLAQSVRQARVSVSRPVFHYILHFINY